MRKSGIGTQRHPQHIGGVYIPPQVFHGFPDLSMNEKALYGRIVALSEKRGYCFASNAYFAHEFGVDTRTIRRWMHNLQKFKLIKRKWKPNVGDRKIKVASRTFSSGGQDKKDRRTPDKNARQSITSESDKRESFSQISTGLQESSIAVFGEVRPEVVDLVEEFGEDDVSAALEMTKNRGKTHHAYTRGILENWRKEGGRKKSRDEIEKEQDRYRIECLAAKSREYGVDI